MLFLLLVIILVLILLGGVGFSTYGPVGFSPLGIVLIIVLILLLTGNLR